MKIFKGALYILFLFVLFAMSVYFGSYPCFAAFFAAVLLLAADIALFVLPLGKINVEIDCDDTSFIKNQSYDIKIYLKSTRVHPIYKIGVTLSIKNKFYDGDNIYIETPLSAFKTRRITLPTEFQKSGIVDISVEKIMFSDTLGIFARKSDGIFNTSVAIMPKKTDTDISIAAYAAVSSDDIPSANVYITNKGDRSGYKEYTPGDRYNTINWKMFARTEKLYTADYENTTAGESVVLLNMYIETLDTALDILCGILNSSSEFTLLWLPYGEEEFKIVHITDKATFENALYLIFLSQPEISKNRAVTEYKKLYRESKILCVSDKLELV